ncbi:MAG: lipoate--protein ligase family protein [Candidatus Omnitrophota bacterium]
MHLIEYDHLNPEETIAMDSFLLMKAESGALGETLRFWNAEEYFVVLGRAGKITEECHVERCRRNGVKIIRRSSGGGTILQGPGCLNYSLILSYKGDTAYKNVRSSYRHILSAITGEFEKNGYSIEFYPLSDLAIGGKKISGNAQARKRRYFLHHGTFLFGFDLGKISFYLKHPPKEPEYRRARTHGDFLTNIPSTPAALSGIIKKAFLPSGAPTWHPAADDLVALRKLAVEKYADLA